MINPNEYKDKYITISVDDQGNKDRMSYYEMSRWMALVEGMDIINNEVSDDAEADVKIKTNALNDYIDDRMHIMLFDLVNQNDRYENIEITEEYLHASKIDMQR